MISLDAITLPSELEWQDEFNWSAVRQVADVSLAGSLVVQEAAQLAGRPITLINGWVTRGVLKQLYAMAQVAATERTLLIGADSYQVLFRHSEQAIEAVPVAPFEDPSDGEFYQINLRFICV
uniref:hypothetical protein n=1 Tax=Marinobacterium profundum TaxID=1714300 RepID=UPI0008341B14|nr:hypothetical protein [Marinobacterium profundum]